MLRAAPCAAGIACTVRGAAAELHPLESRLVRSPGANALIAQPGG
jgi:hypothetical protein